MNSAARAPVESAAPRWGRWIGALALVCTGTLSCVEISGGAAELSWTLRSFTGANVASCATARVGEIRVWWDAPNESRYVAFPCEDRRAATGFVIPSGEVAFRVEPVCEDGTPAREGTYDVPPPLVRTVTRGEVVTLNSLLVIVSTGTECPVAGCTCM